MCDKQHIKEFHPLAWIIAFVLTWLIIIALMMIDKKNHKEIKSQNTLTKETK